MNNIETDPPFDITHEVTDLGIERGLTVVMDPLLEDYFYSIMPFVGWKASRNGIKYHLINRGNKTVISNIPCSREQFYFGAKIKSAIKENLFIVHAKLKSRKYLFF